MEWLNYHHLLYFWAVAKDGSIAKACERLNLAQPTISGQLRMLDETVGEKLFVKSGRGLVLTEMGRLVYQYADEIFGLGDELQDVIRGRMHGRPLRLLAGVSDLVPKLIAYRVLRPALAMAEPVRLVCDEDAPERLLANLVENRLDMVLTDAPINAATRVKTYNHLLGTCGVSLFGSPALANRYRKNFPASLDGAPFLLPIEGSTLRRSLDRWLDVNRIRPLVLGEFKDSALMKVFGEAGVGIFAGPSAIENDIRARHHTEVVGLVDKVTESFYVISVERKLNHAAVVAVCEAARDQLFHVP